MDWLEIQSKNKKLKLKKIYISIYLIFLRIVQSDDCIEYTGNWKESVNIKTQFLKFIRFTLFCPGSSWFFILYRSWSKSKIQWRMEKWSKTWYKQQPTTHCSSFFFMLQEKECFVGKTATNTMVNGPKVFSVEKVVFLKAMEVIITKYR